MTTTRLPSSPGEALALFVAGVLALAAAGATPAATPAEDPAVSPVEERQAAVSALARDLGVGVVATDHQLGCADLDRPDPYVNSADDFYITGCFVPGEEWVTLSAGALDPVVPWEPVAYLLRHEAGHVAAFEAGCYSLDLTVEQHERLADAIAVRYGTTDPTLLTHGAGADDYALADQVLNEGTCTAAPEEGSRR